MVDRRSHQDPGASLTGELADFLIEFSAALQKFAMYPPSHPTVEPAVGEVSRRLTALLRDRLSLNLGVAHDRLVIEGVATDPSHPLLRGLAHRMHRHELGGVTFMQGVRAEEVAGTLALLALEPGREGRKPLGREPKEVLRAWPHAHLYAVHYGQLELAPDGSSERRGSARHAALWVALAQAALAREEVEETDEAPGAVAEAIEAHASERAYEQMIVGHMLRIAEELRTADSEEAAELRGRISDLISTLRPQTLRRLLHMGGDVGQRTRFLLDAADGFAADAVLDLVRVAADESGADISRSMMRLLTKLARHTNAEGHRSAREADESLRSQVRSLLSGWKLDNPNPDTYEAALAKMSRGAPVVRLRSQGENTPTPERIVQMGLEVGDPCKPVARAAQRMIEEGGLKTLVGCLSQMSDGSAAEDQLTRDLWGLVSAPKTLEKLLEAEPPELETLDALLPRIQMSTANVLLDKLTESHSRTTRRELFDRLVGLGAGIGPLIVERVHSEQWFVCRNMLALLGELPALPEEFDPGPFIRHEDARVRREGVRLGLRMPALRGQVAAVALADEDERVVALAFADTEADPPPEAEPQLVAHALDRSSAFRIHAVRALGRLGSDGALAVLLRLTRRPRRWFVWPVPLPDGPLNRAAIEALAVAWADDPHAALTLRRAADSPHSRIRAAASGKAAT